MEQQQKPLATKNGVSKAQNQSYYKSLNQDFINIPVKQSSSLNVQLKIWITQIILIAILGYLLMNPDTTKLLQTNSKKKHSKQLHLVMFLICSIVVSWLYNRVYDYLKSPKNNKQFQLDYKQFKTSRCSILFKIQCFHKKGKQKIITHTAQKLISFKQCYDLSGFIEPNVEKQFKNSYTFIDFEVNYEILQAQEKQILNKMYLDFIQSNMIDKFQKYEKIFQITNSTLNLNQGYLLKGKFSFLKYFLFIPCILCMFWPFLIITEHFIDRYKVNIVKKIKLKD